MEPTYRLNDLCQLKRALIDESETSNQYRQAVLTTPFFSAPSLSPCSTVSDINPSEGLMPHANPKLDFRLVHYKHFDFKFSRLDFFSAPIGISIPMVLIMDRF